LIFNGQMDSDTMPTVLSRMLKITQWRERDWQDYRNANCHSLRCQS